MFMAAIPLAKGAHARLVVVVTKIMPYALALDDQSDSTEFTMRRYVDLVSDLDGEAQFRLCVCRRPDDVVTRLLPRAATVVVGGPAGGLLPSQEVKLVRRMTELGHHVVFVPMPQDDVMARLRSALSLMSVLLATVFALASPWQATAQTSSDTVPRWRPTAFADVAFLGDEDGEAGPSRAGLTPKQNFPGVAAILTFDSSARD